MRNSYGLDVDYFSRKLKLVLAGVNNYTPDELARELTRMAITASIGATRIELENWICGRIGNETV